MIGLLERTYWWEAIDETGSAGDRRAEFLSDATGTLPLSNSAGQVTAEELERSILGDSKCS